jgi:hypothetical protein
MCASWGWTNYLKAFDTAIAVALSVTVGMTLWLLTLGIIQWVANH